MLGDSDEQIRIVVGARRDSPAGGHSPVNLPGTRTCPECRAARPLEWFVAAVWMASTPDYAAVCSVCQETLRLVWAKRLELYFEQMYRPRVAA